MQQINDFEQDIEIRCYSQRTKKSYLFHIKKFLRYYHNDLRQENILRHLNYLKNKGYSPASLSVARAALIYFFTHILKKPITINIPVPKRKQSIPKVVDKAIIIKLIQATKNLKHRTLIELLYSSGTRLEETHKLKWEDVDLVNRLVKVVNGKGSKERLTILSVGIINHLLDLQAQCPKNNPYVFFSSQRPDTYISSKTVQKVIENSCRKAQIQTKVTPHVLRHSFATHLLEDGVDIRYIQALLGHSSIKTTQCYTRVAKTNIVKIKSPLDTLDLTENQNVKTNDDYSESKVKTNGEA